MIAGSVHSFNLLTELAREFGHDDEPTIMDRYYRPLFEDLFNDADEYVERLAYGTMPFSFDTFLERLKDESIGLTMPDASVGYDRIDLYRLLWEKLFKNSSWRDRERARLEGFGDGKRDQIEDIALIHQLVLAKQDGEALKRFTALPVGSLPYMFYWLDGFRVQREWNRMGLSSNTSSSSCGIT
ncbi:hypothetical protein [Mesobacillus boroniphilus]|uniref:Uncharacterized protein n=1 Tax=Mesobacillus boroniphilus JCM 21738 TaxID=1294265 RepID=W4RUM3_9BACI|nr:hypothetical protein [Mesobacillus boroniphilus]GAE48120.1 hypothetical protein JCM21738_5199 [Mesobacillus boroniphilus JCM 21738]